MSSNQVEHCQCDECLDRGVHPILTDMEKRRLLNEAKRIAREAYARVDDLIGRALTGRAA